MKANTQFVGDLFALDFRRKCKHCGEPFEHAATHQVYCGEKCRDSAAWKRNDAVLMARRDALRNGQDLPPIRELSEQDKQAVHYYKEGFGIKSIGKKQGRNHNAVARALIAAGVYHPDPKHNGKAKKGTGEYSMIAKKAKRGELRVMAAFCIRAFRRGTPIEATCKQKGWNASSLWNVINRTRAYKILRRRKKSTPKSISQYSDYAKFKWSSLAFKNEKSFQDHIEQVLVDANIRCSRKALCGHSKSAGDLAIPAMNLFIEAKHSTKPNSFDRCIGQCVRYKLLDNKAVIVCIPHDTTVRQDQIDVLHSIDIPIVNERQIVAYIKGNRESRLTTGKVTTPRARSGPQAIPG